ncbi:hypothetical protein P171DRAFT_441999 [Karstenula rhodostoma CBS 690.94]|uniref:BHLH domain-containing protein n=1 Tax=Karstenula rhodostoma CBS 690.94 TaxID=1392251 RepID=A0A9P4PP10_9PLEO|nr:hypothetical protein P171DRAFT_441999 [Karstenula rhodostoma CBS 690.94]
MDYIDYSSFPMLASSDCSPTTETFSFPTAFDKGFTTGPFTGPDTSLAAFDEYFGRPVSPASALENLDATPSAAPPATQPKPLSHPFTQLDALPPDFPWTTHRPVALDLNPLPPSTDSQTPSLCDSLDAPQNPTTLTSPPPSTPLTFENPAPPNPPKRRRGRPRLDRSSSSSSRTTQRTHRLPHNQVERKYRDGLNATLERLRQRVPALCASAPHGPGSGQGRPSKAMILSGAIEYIVAMERERDAWRGEVERLRRLLRAGGPIG